MNIPAIPKIYHIVHIDRLSSIVDDGHLWCDAEVVRRNPTGTTIGMANIKARRLNQLTLQSRPGLFVGQCVPFYFCPRSVMLYLLHMGNHQEVTYKGGQKPLVHLVADLQDAVDWAVRNKRSWAFTLSNAASRYFEDRADLNELNELDWDAINAVKWSDCKEGKQAEFLMEFSFPWHLFNQIGVSSQQAYTDTDQAIRSAAHKPHIQILPDWYY